MVDPWRPEPLWVQLADVLRKMIKTGQIAPGDPLPSELTLQQRYGVSRGTVRHAIESLREHGLVVTFAGRGTFVPPAEPPPANPDDPEDDAG